MSNITAILGYSSFELIRSKIASILADELSNQLALNVAELAVEKAKATPSQTLIDLYDINIDCIPSKVFEERFYRILPEEMPVINVVLLNVPLNDGTSNSTQMGVNKYQVEVYHSAKSNENNDGDILATLKLHRLLSIIRAILMDRNYIDLGMPGTVGYRQAQDIVIGVPNVGAENADSTIFGKMDLMVKAEENVTDLTGVEAVIGTATMRIFDSELGYYWEI